MAKAKAPLLSFSSKGTLARELTTRRHGKNTIAEKKPIPSQPRTPAQVLQRDYFQSGIQTWHTLDATERQVYYNLNPQIGANPAYLNFMREWLMARLPLHADDHAEGERDPGTKPYPEATHPATVYSLPTAHNRPITHDLSTNKYFFSPLFIGYNFAAFASMSSNRIRAIPYPIITPKQLDQIALYVSTGAAGEFLRLAIYENASPARPGNLLAQSDPIDVSSSGLKTWDISLSLSPALYWLCVINSATIYFARSQDGLSLLGSSNGFYTYLSLYYPTAYGPFPDPAPDMSALVDSYLYPIAIRFT